MSEGEETSEFATTVAPKKEEEEEEEEPKEEEEEKKDESPTNPSEEEEEEEEKSVASDSTPDNDFGDMVLGANLDASQNSTLHIAEQFGSSRPPQYGKDHEETVEEIHQQVVPGVELDTVGETVQPAEEGEDGDSVLDLSNAVDEPVPELDHQFKPGDHVIRWEMLPIVWPIQVHGIVLEVSKQCVTICDFGLTAEMRQDESKQDNKDIEETINKPSNKLWEKVKPKDNRQKERITIHLITTPEQIKPWKKVHYGRGLFGIGGEADDHTHTLAKHNQTNKPKKESKIGNWFRGLGKRKPKNQTTQQQKNTAENTTSTNTTTTTTTTTQRSNSVASLKDNEKTDSADDNDNDNSDPKMTSSSSDPTLHTSATELEHPTQTQTQDAKKEKNKLPESDPPKLVLARTKLLLEQGENILPPYHPFKSNSECIAVFCKTGYWRTLQASVFLHSTAIGNAKSTFVATVGVAASMPILAPAMALAGAAMVGAPYVILKQSHTMWNETTIRLNEAFWSQAPNEVIVECIEHWSDLGDTPRRTSSVATLSEAAEEVQQQEEEEQENEKKLQTTEATKKETKETEEPAKKEEKMKESSHRFVSV